MKKVISVILCTAVVFCSLCFSSFAAGSIQHSVDAKPSGVYDQETGYLNIMGWAFDTSGATVRCYYSIDNGTEIQTDPVTRNDVVTAYSNTCLQVDCGFNQFISVSSLAIGEHTFKLVARSDNNESTLYETTFTVAGIEDDCNEIPSGTYNVDDTDALTVCGWAFNYSGEEVNCYYQIDDNARILFPRIQRSDVQAVYSSCTQLDCGFYYNIPICDFTIGTHTLKLIAVSGSNEKVIASSTVDIECNSSSFKYSVDYYPQGNYTYGEVDSAHIGGWAFSTDGNDTACYYQIDNEDMVLITAENRKDVVSAYSDTCTQLNCGFATDIPFENLTKGMHKIKLIAKSSRMSEVINEYKFYLIGTSGTLYTNSESIANGTYTLGTNNYAEIGGWGYNTSAAATKFYGQFDDGTKFYFETLTRTDVMNAKSDCYRDDCGYHEFVYVGNLSAGSHKFTVYIVSDDQTEVVGTSTFEIIRPTYTISFDANGGTNAPSSMTKTFGKNLNLPTSEPTRKYYKFIGWNTSADGTGETIENSYKNNCDDILYAMWEHEEIELNTNSKLSFDAKSKLIYGEDLIGITANELKNNFVNTSVAVTASFVTTGTEVEISDSNGVYDTASVVVLGDINCDGNIDGMDAVVASCIEGGMLKENQLNSASLSASDCVRNGQIDADDVEKLIEVGIMASTVNQNVVKSRGIYDTDFTIPAGDSTENSIMLNGVNTTADIVTASSGVKVTLNADCEKFNYFGLKYSTDAYVKGTITYELDNENYSEEFFLEPGEQADFRSYIDSIFDNGTSDKIISINFAPLNADNFDFDVLGIATFYREVPDIVTYYQNESIKIGLNMDWGGSLSYYEDLDSNVQAVSDRGIIRIESNGVDKFNSESLNDNVNLINCHDTGRLVQQSYYGTQNYEMGYFNGHYVAYNPVQGGNMYNESSKIVDLQFLDDGIYIKCRPLDWAKSKEYISPSYMEATYSLCGDTLKTQCRFVDYSGYDEAYSGQELPAFYGAATMDRFVYYSGDEPWTDGELTSVTKIDEYEYTKYPSFETKECWGALTGADDDSFSIGLYTPDTTSIVAGVYGSIVNQDANPDMSNSTSYLTNRKMITFKSYNPIEYDFYITTGTVDHIRNTFKNIATDN